MYYIKSLEVLELEENFTEDELKKAYRKACKKWHPDNYANESPSKIKYANDKMAEINAAYEFLIRHKVAVSYGSNKRNNSKNQSSNYNRRGELLGYIVKKYGELRAYLNLTLTVDMPECIKNAYIKLEKIINEACLEIPDLYSEGNKSNIDNWYSKYIGKIVDAYSKLAEDYCQEFNIPIEEANNLHKNLRLKDFYQQLENIRKKHYDKGKAIFERQLADEKWKYQGYEGYKNIERQINAYINKAKTDAAAQKYKNTAEIFEKMDRHILKMFEKYHHLKMNINQLNIEVKDINDKQIQELYKDLKIKVLNGESLSYLEINYNELIELIKEYHRKQEFTKNESAVKDLYTRVITKFNQVLLSLNISSDMDKIEKVYDSLGKILTIFKEYNLGYISYDVLLKLADINFEDNINVNDYIDSDDKSVNYNNVDIFKYTIYLKTTDIHNEDGKSFFVLNNLNNKMYKINSFLQVEEVHYSHEELIYNFTPLDYMINRSKYVGESLLDDCDTYLIYYLTLDEKQQVPNHYLFVRDGIFSIDAFDYANIYDLSGKQNVEIDNKYQNKEQVKLLIKNQLLNILNKYLQNNNNDDNNNKHQYQK